MEKTLKLWMLALIVGQATSEHYILLFMPNFQTGSLQLQVQFMEWKNRKVTKIGDSDFIEDVIVPISAANFDLYSFENFIFSDEKFASQKIAYYDEAMFGESELTSLNDTPKKGSVQEMVTEYLQRLAKKETKTQEEVIEYIMLDSVQHLKLGGLEYELNKAAAFGIIAHTEKEGNFGINLSVNCAGITVYFEQGDEFLYHRDSPKKKVRTGFSFPVKFIAESNSFRFKIADHRDIKEISKDERKIHPNPDNVEVIENTNRWIDNRPEDINKWYCLAIVADTKLILAYVETPANRNFPITVYVTLNRLVVARLVLNNDKEGFCSTDSADLFIGCKVSSYTFSHFFQNSASRFVLAVICQEARRQII